MVGLAGYIVAEEELHSLELESGRRTAVVVEGMTAVGIVPEEVGRTAAAEEGMLAERIVLEVGHRYPAVEEGMIVEGAGRKLAVVEGDIAHVEAAESDHVAAERRTEDIHPDMPFNLLLLYQLSLESAKLVGVECRLIEEQKRGSKRIIYVNRRRTWRRQQLADPPVQ
jgi:hypothetical protein